MRYPRLTPPAGTLAKLEPNASHGESGCSVFLFQGIVLPQIVTGVAANLVNAFANYIFLYQLHLGVK